jgi:hypothetical protein
MQPARNTNFETTLTATIILAAQTIAITQIGNPAINIWSVNSFVRVGSS